MHLLYYCIDRGCLSGGGYVVIMCYINHVYFYVCVLMCLLVCTVPMS